MKRNALKIAFILLTCLQGVGFARTWHLFPDGTGDAATLRVAFELAADGDSILLEPGDYSADGEAILERKNSLTIVASVDGSYPTTPTLAFWNSSYVNVVGCRFSYSGTGFFANNVSRVLLDSCIMEGGLKGALIDADSVEVTRSVFRGNGRSDAMPTVAGGLTLGYTDGIAPTIASITDCIFEDNASEEMGGAIYICTASSSDLLVENNFFVQNESRYGAAIYADGCSIGELVIRQNTFVQNKSQDGAVVTVMRGEITGNLFAQNDCFAFGAIGSPEVRGDCNLMWQNWASSNGAQAFGYFNWTPDTDIILDPLFCGPDADVYYELAEDSPALLSNFTGEVRIETCEGTMGAFGVGCAISPVVVRSWGSIKKQFLNLAPRTGDEGSTTSGARTESE